ncbi:MAG: hypothetical protein ACYC1D_02050 [Acidimicrobiales bacterium]
MLALVVVLLAVVVLLCVVTAGLLRSHADIIRALHDLGVGVGDPSVHPSAHPLPAPSLPTSPLPSERSSTSVHDLEGVTPDGDSVAVSARAAGLTLLAFLSSGCTTCAAFWAALGDPRQRALLPSGVRVVVVTKGPEYESPDAIRARAPAGVTVVMSTPAWGDYEVPGSPFFALIDGAAARRVGEGVANQFGQIADLVNRALAEAGETTTGRAARGGLDGPAREAANDVELVTAGIHPGDPSLYPRTLEDVFQSSAQPPGRGEAGPADAAPGGGIQR